MPPSVSGITLDSGIANDMNRKRVDLPSEALPAFAHCVRYAFDVHYNNVGIRPIWLPGPRLSKTGFDPSILDGSSQSIAPQMDGNISSTTPHGPVVSLDEAATLSAERASDLISVHDALNRLSELDARKGRVVELRFFGGLSVEETAEVLVSPNTVLREWRTAKAWLHRELSDPVAASSAT
jgi:hypothetical protein